MLQTRSIELWVALHLAAFSLAEKKKISIITKNYLNYCFFMKKGHNTVVYQMRSEMTIWGVLTMDSNACG